MTERTLAGTLGASAAGVVAGAAVVAVAGGEATAAAAVVGGVVALAAARRAGDPRYVSLSGIACYLGLGGVLVALEGAGVVAAGLLSLGAVGLVGFGVRTRGHNLRRLAAVPAHPGPFDRAVAGAAGRLLAARRTVRRVADDTERAVALAAAVVVSLLAVGLLGGVVGAAARIGTLGALFAPFYVLTDWRALDGRRLDGTDAATGPDDAETAWSPGTLPELPSVLADRIRSAGGASAVGGGHSSATPVPGASVRGAAKAALGLALVAGERTRTVADALREPPDGGRSPDVVAERSPAQGDAASDGGIVVLETDETDDDAPDPAGPPARSEEPVYTAADSGEGSTDLPGPRVEARRGVVDVEVPDCPDPATEPRVDARDGDGPGAETVSERVAEVLHGADEEAAEEWAEQLEYVDVQS